MTTVVITMLLSQPCSGTKPTSISLILYADPNRLLWDRKLKKATIRHLTYLRLVGMEISYKYYKMQW